MGNTRNFRAGRKAHTQSLKDRVKLQDLELARQRGINMSLQAQLSATKMERPADLEEWIEAMLPDMDEDERAQYEAMSDVDREQFKTELSQRINTAKLLNDLG